MEKIIGRAAEKKILAEVLESGEAELVAVYGRRRVGKTFLIKNFFAGQLRFSFSGVHNATLETQLLNFSQALGEAMTMPVKPSKPVNWLDAFFQLGSYLDTLPGPMPKVVLFDEMPWIHTPKSGFLDAFGHWWNTWASDRAELKVIICGSAASWMIENIINNRGGLHNRVSRRIRLLPFTLLETRQYLETRHITPDQYQLLLLYMAIGGVPQYLKQVQQGKSAVQNIDLLFFEPGSPIHNEFDNLYQSLFLNAENHERIVRALAKHPQGLQRNEVSKAAKLKTGGTLTKILGELEESGFINQYIPFGKNSRDSIYKLTDEYSLFFLRFVENSKASGTGTWMQKMTGQSYNSWCGLAFETVCQKHYAQIKKALGIGGVYVEISAWRYAPKDGTDGAQIDLLLDRADHCINICEIKFSKEEFTIDKAYAAKIDAKTKIFKQQTKTKKSLFPTMITTYGTAKNSYYIGRITNEITMDALFEVSG